MELGFIELSPAMELGPGEPGLAMELGSAEHGRTAELDVAEQSLAAELGTTYIKVMESGVTRIKVDPRTVIRIYRVRRGIGPQSRVDPVGARADQAERSFGAVLFGIEARRQACQEHRCQVSASGPTNIGVKSGIGPQVETVPERAVRPGHEKTGLFKLGVGE